MNATDRGAGGLAEWQLTFGQGTCVDAFRGGDPVLAGDLHGTAPACHALAVALRSGGSGSALTAVTTG